MAGVMRAPRLLSRLRRAAPEEEVEQQDTNPSAPLVRRYFLAQDERPAGVDEIEIGRLDPFLRGLLFTDGTVTRSLAVHTLASVSVERVSQSEGPVPAAVAGYLETEPEDVSIRRRVRIGSGEAAVPVLWAESHIVLDRLPPGFAGLLDGAPDGIGQSLQRVALESYRELLWFGLDAAPEWAGAPAGESQATIRRLYRIISDRQATILISESFAVEQQGGVYRLAGLAGPSRVGETG
jgi:chorismate-pyruvate lyase